uniref:Uncharacterized protein n=1 Tax=Mycetohabitans sp. TaxID=2571162 RepID=A0A6B9HDW5_9BURK|nr:hypothetical protein [Mycetohabitans sp.]
MLVAVRVPPSRCSPRPRRVSGLITTLKFRAVLPICSNDGQQCNGAHLAESRAVGRGDTPNEAARLKGKDHE